jgi:hypothetical protein
MDQRLAMQEPDEVTRRSFRAFDAHAKGYISAADFERVMNGIAPHLPRETISLVFSEVDTDRDGDGPLIAPLRLIAPLIRLVRSTQIVMVTGRHVVKPQLHLDHRPRTTRPLAYPPRSSLIRMCGALPRCAGRVSYKDFHTMMSAVRPGGARHGARPPAMRVPPPAAATPPRTAGGHPIFGAAFRTAGGHAIGGAAGLAAR